MHVLSLYKLDSASGTAVEMAGEVTRKTINPRFSQVAWSTDGSTIYRVEGLRSIAMRNGASAEWKTVLTDPAATLVYEPTPSPDGTEIAYVAESDPNGRGAQIKAVTLETGRSER